MSAEFEPNFEELDRIIAEAEAAEAAKKNGKAKPQPPPKSQPKNDRLDRELGANPLRAFEIVLGELTRKGSTLYAKCPFHDDQHPSLSIKTDEPVCYCHTKCKQGWHVMKVAMQVWGCDYATAARRMEAALGVERQQTNGTKPKSPKLVNTIRYQVRDLEGELKSTHVRLEYDDGSKTMPWEPSGLKTSDLPLFQVEKTVDSADGDAVIVTEGEKCALKLWEIDHLLAVGTVTGAKKIPCDESLKPLSRLKVYLWPDHDTDGYGHMLDIGTRLLALGHTDVWQIKWREAPIKGDAADFDGDVNALLGEAKRFELPGQREQVRIGEIDRTPIDAFDAYTEMRADQRGYSWEGNIKEGCSMVLSALMGSGKTTLSMNVTRGWALGEPVLGRICKSSKTLVVVSSKEWDAWADTIGFWEIRGKIFLIPSYKVQFGDGREQAQWFEQTMRTLGCSTFVLDTMFDFFGIPPHNTGDQNRMVMAEQTPLLEVVRTNNWSGIVTGHPPKSEAQAVISRDPEESFGGHTAWSAQHRMRAVIYRKAQGKSTFRTARGGYGDTGMLEEKMLLFDEVTRLVSLGGKWSEYLGTVALPSILQALENDHGWMGRSALVNATKKGEGWVKAGVKEGLRSGALKANGRDGRARKYALPDEPDEAPPPPKQRTFDD